MNLSGLCGGSISREDGVMRSSEKCRSLYPDLFRASKATATRYERDAPCELVSVDVRKIGRIPPGGGVSRSRGRSNVKRTTRVGYYYIDQFREHGNDRNPVHMQPDCHSSWTHQTGTTRSGILLISPCGFARRAW